MATEVHLAQTWSGSTPSPCVCLIWVSRSLAQRLLRTPKRRRGLFLKGSAQSSSPKPSLRTGWFLKAVSRITCAVLPHLFARVSAKSNYTQGPKHLAQAFQGQNSADLWELDNYGHIYQTSRSVHSRWKKMLQFHLWLHQFPDFHPGVRESQPSLQLVAWFDALVLRPGFPISQSKPSKPPIGGYPPVH